VILAHLLRQVSLLSDQDQQCVVYWFCRYEVYNNRLYMHTLHAHMHIHTQYVVLAMHDTPLNTNMHKYTAS